MVNRGASYADGKIIYNTLDDHTVAVDAHTGQRVWETQVGDIQVGETTTMAAYVVKNMIFVGISGGELGVRGRLTALDLKSARSNGLPIAADRMRTRASARASRPFTRKIRGKDQGVEKLDPGPMESWGWHRMGMDLLRSRAESDLLRHGKSRSLECGYAARRQQVVHHYLGARSGNGYGEVGLPSRAP